MDRLEKIRAKRASLDDEFLRKEQKALQMMADVKASINKLVPKMEELVKLAEELRKNDIPLGRVITRLGFREEEFLANGIDHKIGFVTFKGSSIDHIGIGILGGGCCGESLVMSSKGDILANPMSIVAPPFRTRENARNDYLGKAKKFIDTFDEFYNRVLEYVDNL